MVQYERCLMSISMCLVRISEKNNYGFVVTYTLAYVEDINVCGYMVLTFMIPMNRKTIIYKYQYIKLVHSKNAILSISENRWFPFGVLRHRAMTFST